MSNELANKPQNTLSLFFNQENVKKRFEQIMGDKSNAFITSVLQIASSNTMLKKCDPKSIFGAAMQAATMNLPINNNLGFAYIVPYKNSAQFQIGYKGFIQLAQRSGAFKTINSLAVYKGQLVSQNPMTNEYEFDWNIEPEGEPIGYVAYFKLLNGFEAISYMSKLQLENHANKYSQSYKKGFGVWKDNFEAMAKKTVLKLLLSRYAPLNIDDQLAKAVQIDQAEIIDEQEPLFLDNAVE